MTIRSIEMQVLVPRATDVSKSQQITDHQASLQQQQGAEQMQKIVTRRQQQVQKTPKDEGGKVRREKDPQEKKKQQQQSDQGESADLNQQEQANGTNKIAGRNPKGQTNQAVGHVIDIKT